MASEAYKQSIVDSSAADIVYTPLFTGVHGNYLRSSIEAAGLDPADHRVAEAEVRQRGQQPAVREALRVAVALLDPQAHDEALAVARTNALRAGVGARISLMHGDLAEPLVSSRAPGDPPHLDLLIANLPYVPSDALDAARDAARASASFAASFNEADGVGTPRDLSRIAIAAEPRIALDGGADGLDLIRRLIAELPRLLRPGGVAILEFGDGQGDAIAYSFLCHRCRRNRRRRGA